LNILAVLGDGCPGGGQGGNGKAVHNRPGKTHKQTNNRPGQTHNFLQEKHFSPKLTILLNSQSGQTRNKRQKQKNQSFSSG